MSLGSVDLSKVTEFNYPTSQNVLINLYNEDGSVDPIFVPLVAIATEGTIRGLLDNLSINDLDYFDVPIDAKTSGMTRQRVADGILTQEVYEHYLTWLKEAFIRTIDYQGLSLNKLISYNKVRNQLIENFKRYQQETRALLIRKYNDLRYVIKSQQGYQLTDEDKLLLELFGIKEVVSVSPTTIGTRELPTGTAAQRLAVRAAAGSIQSTTARVTSSASRSSIFTPSSSAPVSETNSQLIALDENLDKFFKAYLDLYLTLYSDELTLLAMATLDLEDLYSNVAEKFEKALKEDLLRNYFKKIEHKVNFAEIFQTLLLSDAINVPVYQQAVKTYIDFKTALEAVTVGYFTPIDQINPADERDLRYLAMICNFADYLAFKTSLPSLLEIMASNIRKLQFHTEQGSITIQQFRYMSGLRIPKVYAKENGDPLELFLEAKKDFAEAQKNYMENKILIESYFNEVDIDWSKYLNFAGGVEYNEALDPIFSILRKYGIGKLVGDRKKVDVEIDGSAIAGSAITGAEAAEGAMEVEPSEMIISEDENDSVVALKPFQTFDYVNVVIQAYIDLVYNLSMDRAKLGELRTALANKSNYSYVLGLFADYEFAEDEASKKAAKVALIDELIHNKLANYEYKEDGSIKKDQQGNDVLVGILTLQDYLVYIYGKLLKEAFLNSLQSIYLPSINVIFYNKLQGQRDQDLIDRMQELNRDFILDNAIPTENIERYKAEGGDMLRKIRDLEYSVIAEPWNYYQIEFLIGDADMKKMAEMNADLKKLYQNSTNPKIRAVLQG